VAFVAVVSQIQPGVEAGGRSTPPVAGACRGTAPLGRRAGAGVADRADAGATPGAWWRIVDDLDAVGTLVGRTLVAGVAAATTLTMPLDPESMARGPVRGLLVVTNDDGSTSELRLVSIAQGCSWIVHRDANVIRSAILDARGHVAYAHLLERATRADLGIFRVDGGDRDAPLAAILDPLAPQADLGRIWATELRLDAAGESLAVQSCSDRGCLIRVLSLAAFGSPVTELRGAGQGSIVGFARDRIVTWAFCDGLPCAIQAWKAGAAQPEALAERAVGAGLTADGRYLLIVTDGSSGRAVRVDLVEGASAAVEGLVAGELPLGIFVTAAAGFEVADDEIGVVAAGRDPRAFAPGAATVVP